MSSGDGVRISRNKFIGNTAGAGGGISCGSGVTVVGNTFVGNSAANQGGGVWFGGGLVSGNIFKQNTAATGGGIYASGVTVTLINNLFAKNSQTSGSSQGGAIWVNASATLNVINNTISQNTAAGGGGGLACQVNGVTEVLNVYNNIIWGNSAAGNGADVWLAGTGQKKTFLFNDVHGMYGVWDIAQNLQDVDPQFFDPVNGDYHLRGTSPCLNAGTNGAPSIPLVDLDGNIRISNATVDLGSYEFNNSALHPADINADLVISTAEFNAYAAAWKNAQVWASSPVVIPADFVTRAGYLLQNGGSYHNDGSGQPTCWKVGL